MFTEDIKSKIEEVAREFGIEPAALLAVAEIESAGSVFAVIDGNREPLIRFEGHYFDDRLTGNAQARARAEGLASPHPGEIRNPISQVARWRLLARAAEIDRQAAYESVSWGLGQVMGAHWAWLGFVDVDALVAEARDGAEGQARLMARFVDKSGLTQTLRHHDWETFAREYNGPGFRKNAYDTLLEAAYRRHTSGNTNPGDEANVVAPRLLAEGSFGEDVRDLQHQLAALGYPLAVDGIFGSRTEEAARRFQREHKLPADGVVGPNTLAAIKTALPFGSAGSGYLLSAWQRITRWFSQQPS